MQIRNRLTLQFSLLTGIILLAVLGSIYFATTYITRSEFFYRLKERSDVAAKIYFEKDELSKSIYDEFERKYLTTLPDEVTQIFNESNERSFIEDNPSTFYSKEIIDKVRKEKMVFYQEAGHQVVGAFYHDNQGDFVIFVSATDVFGNEHINRLLILIVIVYLTALSILFISGRIFSSNALRPISDLVHRVQQITASNLHLRIPQGKNDDEINELAVTFNDMLFRLENSFVTEHSFVHNASHELRTPLTSIIGELQVFLSRDRTTGEYRQALQSVLGDAEQMNELLNGLLHIAQIDFREMEIPFEDIRLDELLLEVIEDVKTGIPPIVLNVSFENLPEDSSNLIVSGNRQLLSIALQNLMRNAYKFSHAQSVDLGFRVIDSDLIVRITDHGIGIDKEELPHIFEPFYRSPKAREFKGHGIGLALVDRICKLHKIMIHVDSSPENGSSFILHFHKDI